MKPKDFLAGTFKGHIVLMEVFGGLPLFFMGVAQNLSDGTLDFWLVLKMAVVIFGGCVGAAAALWFAVTKDLARKKWPNGPPP